MAEELSELKNRKHIMSIVVVGLLLLLLPAVILLTRTNKPITTNVFAKDYPRGDVNHDGKVTLDDAKAIRLLIETHGYTANADFNKDNKVDENDVRAFYDILSLR